MFIYEILRNSVLQFDFTSNTIVTSKKIAAWNFSIVESTVKTRVISGAVLYHYVNVPILIKFSQKTSVFTLIIISSP